MARIAGVNIPQNKLVQIGLTYIYGIGRTHAKAICKKTEIPSERRVHELTDNEVVRIRELIEEHSGAEIVIYGSTVIIIGDEDALPMASQSIERLLHGAEHSSVLKHLETERRKRRMSSRRLESIETPEDSGKFEALVPGLDAARRKRDRRYRGAQVDPENSEEIEEIIERKMKEAEEAKAAQEASEADPDKKIAPEVENFVTTYYEFSGTFTTNLRNSTKFLQVGIGVSTQYDDTVMANVEMHQLSLRSEILGMMSEFSEEEIQGKAGRDALSAAIAEAINKKLIELEDFGGVESVHFTSFMLQ